MSAIDSASLNSFERWADFGTWLVIIGVAGEGVEILLKILQHKLTCKTFLLWCERHEFSIEIWGALFWIMVVAGLAVEFRYGHKAKTISDAENVRLVQKAAELTDRAATNELRVAVLSNNTVRLSIQLEEAKSNNLVLGHLLLARTLTEPLTATLKKFSGVVSHVEYVGETDGEPYNFAGQIFEVLHGTGAAWWNSPPNISNRTNDGIFILMNPLSLASPMPNKYPDSATGLFSDWFGGIPWRFSGASSNTLEQASSELADAFNTNGIFATREHDTSVEQHTIVIHVGSKLATDAYRAKVFGAKRPIIPP